MLTMPSFKKSLIVEQFQGNYLKAKSLVNVDRLPLRKYIKVSFHKKLKYSSIDGMKRLFSYIITINFVGKSVLQNTITSRA